MSLGTTAPVDAGAAEPAARSGVRVGRASAWWILIAGVIGLLSSADLLIEKIEMLKNPSYVPSCSINPVLACGSVINTPQASVFGPPNPLFGVVAFTVVIVTGVLQGGPAAQAGMAPGDVIVAIGGVPVEDVAQLLSKVAALKPGVATAFALERKSQALTMSVTPGTRPKPPRPLR